MIRQPRQLELLDVATSDRQEQLDIGFRELPALATRLKREGRFIFRLGVRKGGYRVTVKPLSTRKFTCAVCGDEFDLRPDAVRARACGLPGCPGCPSAITFSSIQPSHAPHQTPRRLWRRTRRQKRNAELFGT